MTQAEPITNAGAGDEINPLKYEVIQHVQGRSAVDGLAQDTAGGIVQSYRLFYDSESGNARVLPVDRNGKVVPNAEPIYANGVWNLDLMKRNDGQSYFLDEEDRKRIDNTIKNGIKQTIQTTGGGDEAPAWLDEGSEDYKTEKKLNLNTGEVETVNVVSFNEASFYSANSDDYDHSKSNQGQFNIENAVALSSYNPNRFGVNTDHKKNLITRALNSTRGFGTFHNISDYDMDSDVLFRKIVKYPMDMMNNMDHMFIQCYGYNPPYADALNSRNRGDGSTNVGFGFQRSSPFRKKLGAGIKLPMPNNMMDGNPRMWDDGEMNAGSGTAIQQTSTNPLRSTIFFDNFFMGGITRRAGQARERMQRETGRAAMTANMISQLSSNMGYDIPPEAILSRTVGVVANSNTELLFTGVALRSFEFQWQMSPRDELEAANVRMIIRAFKQWSAPRKLKKMESGAKDSGKAGGPSYFLGTPNIFRLRYLTKNKKDIMGVNKFKPCALTDISVNYAPEGQWMAYDNGMPVSVVMTLRFNELEPIYNTDYTKDVANGRAYNSDDPGSLGDLFPISFIKQNDPDTAEIGY
tara:strand:+ start:4156 stop:5889 length:1734 start_codon:yes stop_codon:yes gene_type:complete